MNRNKDKTLLKKLLGQHEGNDVEFKMTVDALESEDIIAFANSHSGGFIIIGVKEIKHKIKSSEFELINTQLNDYEKLKIINKAQDCNPPVELDISSKKISERNIILVTIPSGKFKPYCTKRGVYKIRGDGRNQTLTPELLFEIFLKREYKTFIERFRHATEELTKDVMEIQDFIENSQHQLENTMQQIIQETGDASSFASEAFALAESIHNAIDNIDRSFDLQYWNHLDLEEKVNLILQKLNIEDPKVTRRKQRIKSYLEKLILEKKAVKKRLIKKHIINAFVKIFEEQDEIIYKDEISEIYDQLVAIHIS